jgi:hypothetical protein
VVSDGEVRIASVVVVGVGLRMGGGGKVRCFFDHGTQTTDPN